MARKSDLKELLEGVEKLSFYLPIWMIPILSIALGAFAFWVLNVLFTPFVNLGVTNVSSVPFWGGCFVALLSFIAGLRGWRSRRERRERLAGTKSQKELASLSWREFELLVADHYRALGYQVSEGKGNVPDGGVDLHMVSPQGQNVLVQCKHWRTSKIGVKIVREMLGVLQKSNADKVLIIGSGKFTKEAIDFATGEAIELIDGSAFLKQRNGGFVVSQEMLIEPDYGSCPRCGKTLVKRVAKKGSRSGSSFIGCSGFPSCKYTRN